MHGEIPGSTRQVLRVKDERGVSYVCPDTMLRDPNRVSEEEKAFCELDSPSG